MEDSKYMHSNFLHTKFVSGDFLQPTCISNKINRKKRSVDKDRPLIDIFLNPNSTEKRAKLKNYTKNSITNIEQYFSNGKLKDVYPALFQLLWYSQLPCFPVDEISVAGLLVRCKLAGEIVDCRKIFQTVATDLGMCCSFNAKDVLRQSIYKDLILKMRNESNKAFKEYSNDWIFLI